MPDILKEYLIRLGAQVDSRAMAKFQGTLDLASRSVADHVGGMAATVAKASFGIVGAFTSISAAVVGVAESAAMADQSYRLMGRRMLMTKDSAMKLDLVTKTLGASLAEIRWDPELSFRMRALIPIIDKLQHGLGPNFEKNMVGIRDLSFEFKRLQMDTKFLGWGFASSIFEKLFPNTKALNALDKWISHFEDQLPAIANDLANDVIPVLKTTWEMLKAIGKAAEGGATLFTQLVGAISGDEKLKHSAGNFHDLSTAIQDVESWLTRLIDRFSQGESILGHGASAIGELARGHVSAAAKEGKMALHEITSPIGPMIADSPEVISLGSRGLMKTDRAGKAGEPGGLDWKAALATGGVALAVGSIGFSLVRSISKHLGITGIGRFIGRRLGIGGKGGIGGGLADTVNIKAAVVNVNGPGGLGGAAGAAGKIAAGLGAGGAATVGGIVAGAAILTGLEVAKRKVAADLKTAGLKPGQKITTEQVESLPSMLKLETKAKHTIQGWFGGASPGKPSALAAKPNIPNIPVGKENIVEKIASVISSVEAADSAKSASKGLNNPGNLRSWGNLPKVHTGAGDFVQFPTREAGNAALLQQIEKNIGRGLTPYQFFAGNGIDYPGYAPSKDNNNPKLYAERLAKVLGIDINTPINQIPSAAGGMLVPGGVGALVSLLHPKEMVLPADLSAGLGRLIHSGPVYQPNAEAALMHRYAPEVASTVNHKHISIDFGGLNMGGIHITQPGADMAQIRREVGGFIREQLMEQIQRDLVQINPMW